MSTPSQQRRLFTLADSQGNVLWISLLLGFITALLYAYTTQFEFVALDDQQYVVDNSFVQAGLTREGLRWALTGEQLGNWHPLTTFSFLLTSELFGMRPSGFHTVNVFLHTLNTVLLFLLLKRMTGALWSSAAVAALFGWHPLHVESVAWIAERKDVLSGLFWILTIWAYVRYVEDRRWWRYVLALLCFALGLLSKPMVVTLPFVLLLLDYWPLRRVTLGKSAIPTIIRFIAEKVPFLVLTLAASWWTYVVQQRGGATLSMEGLSVWMRLSTALVSYTLYLAKTIWPANLAVIYPYPSSWLWWQVTIAVVILISLSALALRFARRAPYLLVGWLWFLGTLVPVIGVVQVGMQAMADRYTYLPLIGVFVMLVWGANDLLPNSARHRQVVPLLWGAALIGCLVCTSLQLRHWQNSLALFRQAVDVTKDNGFAQKFLGHSLKSAGRIDEALAHYAEAARLLPRDPDIHFYMGLMLANQGKTEAAMARYAEALRLEPGHAYAHFNLANIYFARQRWQEAANHYTEAARLQPGSDATENNLATSLAMLGQPEQAAMHFLEALRINPNYASAHFNLALTRASQGRKPEAIAHFKETLRLKPDFVGALDRLARLRATDRQPELRDGAEAVLLAERACTLTQRQDPLLLDTLAASYAEAGRFGDAVTTLQKALTIGAGLPPVTIQAMRQRLSLYQAGVPFRE